MNTLWFGDHPVPSEHTISPATPVRLSNIQIQAQAELERRHRSSSHGHSLDRKSIYSTGMTESHLSKGLSDYHQGYEGIGYAYDNRGRLIHGGACLPERSASRKRRLLDGHESLSRVWIPQSGEHYPIKQISDKTPSSLMSKFLFPVYIYIHNMLNIEISLRLVSINIRYLLLGKTVTLRKCRI